MITATVNANCPLPMPHVVRVVSQAMRVLVIHRVGVRVAAGEAVRMARRRQPVRMGLAAEAVVVAGAGESVAVSGAAEAVIVAAGGAVLRRGQRGTHRVPARPVGRQAHQVAPGRGGVLAEAGRTARRGDEDRRAARDAAVRDRVRRRRPGVVAAQKRRSAGRAAAQPRRRHRAARPFDAFSDVRLEPSHEVDNAPSASLRTTPSADAAGKVRLYEGVARTRTVRDRNCTPLGRDALAQPPPEAAQ